MFVLFVNVLCGKILQFSSILLFYFWRGKEENGFYIIFIRVCYLNRVCEQADEKLKTESGIIYFYWFWLSWEKLNWKILKGWEKSFKEN